VTRRAFTRRVLAAAAFGAATTLVASAPPGVASPVQPPPGSYVGTTLPVGWELCILQGVGAPVTQQNVADLDVWQVEEGGSTQNTAAFNPFNTRGQIDAAGAPLPSVISANGFPAFPSWQWGCAATVATLVQSNMTPIVAALRRGDVYPPGVFLSDVDQSQWCAPSPDGTPCYASALVPGDGSSGRSVALIPDTSEDGFTLYTGTGKDLSTYDSDTSVVAQDQEALAASTEQLVMTEQQLSIAQVELGSAKEVLRRIAIYDYTTDGTFSRDNNLQPFEIPSENDLLSQVFGKVATSTAISRVETDQASVALWSTRRTLAQQAVDHANAVLDSADAAQLQAVVKVVGDMKKIQAAAACAGTGTGVTTGAPTAAVAISDPVPVAAARSCVAALAAL
jgi:hypothetical protein